MKVKELIAYLQKEDPEMDVLYSDHQYWYYDISYVKKKFILKGQEVFNEKNTKYLCVTLVAK